MRSHEDMCVFYKKQPTYNPQKTGGHLRKVSKSIHKKDSKMSTNYNEIKNHSYDSTERFPKSVWKFPKDTQKLAIHPTQKPLALGKEIIATYSNKNDNILDNTMGSGTFGVAAISLERNFIGIEKDTKIFSLAKDRIDKAKDVAIKEN